MLPYFLAQMAHPLVQPDTEQAMRLVTRLSSGVRRRGPGCPARLSQPSHVEGIAQTMHGTSFQRNFASPAAEERHTEQYCGIYGYRAMHQDGWWLAEQIGRIPWDATPDAIGRFAAGVWQPDDDPVEPYYLPDDFAQANDLAAASSPPSTVARSGPRCCNSRSIGCSAHRGSDMARHCRTLAVARSTGCAQEPS
jgi:hypothetical protein